MLDSCWTRVGLTLDSRWTVFDLFLVQFLVQLLDIMLDSCWTPFTPALGFCTKTMRWKQTTRLEL